MAAPAGGAASHRQRFAFSPKFDAGTGGGEILAHLLEYVASLESSVNASASGSEPSKAQGMLSPVLERPRVPAERSSKAPMSAGSRQSPLASYPISPFSFSTERPRRRRSRAFGPGPGTFTTPLVFSSAGVPALGISRPGSARPGSAARPTSAAASDRPSSAAAAMPPVSSSLGGGWRSPSPTAAAPFPLGQYHSRSASASPKRPARLSPLGLETGTPDSGASVPEASAAAGAPHQGGTFEGLDNSCTAAQGASNDNEPLAAAQQQRHLSYSLVKEQAAAAAAAQFQQQQAALLMRFQSPPALLQRGGASPAESMFSSSTSRGAGAASPSPPAPHHEQQGNPRHGTFAAAMVEELAPPVRAVWEDNKMLREEVRRYKSRARELEVAWQAAERALVASRDRLADLSKSQKEAKAESKRLRKGIVQATPKEESKDARIAQLQHQVDVLKKAAESAARAAAIRERDLQRMLHEFQVQLRKADERWAEAEKEKRRREAAALAEEEKRAAEKAEREAARKAEEEGVQACGDDSADQNSLKKLSRQALEAAVCEAEEKARLAEDEVKAAVIAARAEGARMLKDKCHEHLVEWLKATVVGCADAAAAKSECAAAECAAALSAVAAARSEMAGEVAEARGQAARALADAEAVRQELIAAQAAAAAAAAAASDLAMRYGRSRSIATVVKAVDALRFTTLSREASSASRVDAANDCAEEDSRSEGGLRSSTASPSKQANRVGWAAAVAGIAAGAANAGAKPGSVSCESSRVSVCGGVGKDGDIAGDRADNFSGEEEDDHGRQHLHSRGGVRSAPGSNQLGAWGPARRERGASSVIASKANLLQPLPESVEARRKSSTFDASAARTRSASILKGGADADRRGASIAGLSARRRGSAFGPEKTAAPTTKTRGGSVVARGGGATADAMLAALAAAGGPSRRH